MIHCAITDFNKTNRIILSIRAYNTVAIRVCVKKNVHHYIRICTHFYRYTSMYVLFIVHRDCNVRQLRILRRMIDACTRT